MSSTRPSRSMLSTSSRLTTRGSPIRRPFLRLTPCCKIPIAWFLPFGRMASGDTRQPQGTEPPQISTKVGTNYSFLTLPYRIARLPPHDSWGG